MAMVLKNGFPTHYRSLVKRGGYVKYHGFNVSEGYVLFTTKTSLNIMSTDLTCRNILLIYPSTAYSVVTYPPKLILLHAAHIPLQWRYANSFMTSITLSLTLLTLIKYSYTPQLSISYNTSTHFSIMTSG
jgi:hypothetical protein